MVPMNGYKALVQRQQFIHLHLLVDGRCVHACPDLNKAGNIRRQIQKLLREADVRLHDRYGHPPESVFDQFDIINGRHKAFFINAETAGSSGNLFDLPRFQVPLCNPVKFLGLHKYNPADGKVQSHSDSICTDYNVCLLFQETADLLPSGSRRQASINHAAANSLLFQVCCQGKHRLFGKHDQCIPFVKVIFQRIRLLFHSQAGIPLMADNPVLIFAAFDHLCHDGLRLRRHAQMDLFGPQAQYGTGPVMAPVRISHHLAFVHHHNVKVLVVIEHLYRAGLAEGARHLYGLFSCDHRTGQTFQVAFIVHFQSKQTQRTEIGSMGAGFQSLQSIVGLSAVGGAYVQDELPLHLARLRVFFLRSALNGLPNPFLDSFGNVKKLIAPFQGIHQKITSDSLHLQNLFQFLILQIRKKFQVSSCKFTTEILHLFHPFCHFFPLFRWCRMLLAHQAGADLGEHGMDIAEFIGPLHFSQIHFRQSLAALSHLAE